MAHILIHGHDYNILREPTIDHQLYLTMSAQNLTKTLNIVIGDELVTFFLSPRNLARFVDRVNAAYEDLCTKTSEKAA